MFFQLENQLSTWWVSSFCLQLSLKSSSSHFYSTVFAYFHACSFPPACPPIHPPSASSPPQSCSLQVRVSSVLLRETSSLIYSFSFKKLFSQWVLCFPGFVEKTVEWFHVALLFPLFLLVVLEFDRLVFPCWERGSSRSPPFHLLVLFLLFLQGMVFGA